MAAASIILVVPFMWVEVIMFTAEANHFAEYERDIIFVLTRDATFPIVCIDMDAIAIESTVSVVIWTVIAALHRANVALRTLWPAEEVPSYGGG